LLLKGGLYQSENIISFEDIKSSYLEIIETLFLDDKNDYLLDKEANLDGVFNQDICKLHDVTKLLKYAINVNDQVAMQAALVHIRVCSVRLAGFFEDIKDDADSLLKSPVWPDSPESYQVPEFNNFPHK